MSPARFWRHAAGRRRAFQVLGAAAVLSAATAACLAMRPWAVLPRVAHSLAEFGPAGAIAYVLVATVAFVVPPAPDLVLVAAAGRAFGALPAAIYSTAAALAGGAISFTLARRLGRRPLVRLLGAEWMRRVDTYTARMGWPALVLIRLVPGLNFSLVSLAAGLTKLRLASFLTATLLGSLPQILLFSLVGDTLRPVMVLAIVVGVALLGAGLARVFTGGATGARRESALAAKSAAGHEFVEAYVEFTHYVERRDLDATTQAVPHAEWEEKGGLEGTFCAIRQS